MKKDFLHLVIYFVFFIASSYCIDIVIDESVANITPEVVNAKVRAEFDNISSTVRVKRIPDMSSTDDIKGYINKIFGNNSFALVVVQIDISLHLYKVCKDNISEIGDIEYSENHDGLFKVYGSVNNKGYFRYQNSHHVGLGLIIEDPTFSSPNQKFKAANIKVLEPSRNVYIENGKVNPMKTAIAASEMTTTISETKSQDQKIATTCIFVKSSTAYAFTNTRPTTTSTTSLVLESISSPDSLIESPNQFPMLIVLISVFSCLVSISAMAAFIIVIKKRTNKDKLNHPIIL